MSGSGPGHEDQPFRGLFASFPSARRRFAWQQIQVTRLGYARDVAKAGESPGLDCAQIQLETVSRRTGPAGPHTWACTPPVPIPCASWRRSARQRSFFAVCRELMQSNQASTRRRRVMDTAFAQPSPRPFHCFRLCLDPPPGLFQTVGHQSLNPAPQVRSPERPGNRATRRHRRSGRPCAGAVGSSMDMLCGQENDSAHRVHRRKARAAASPAGGGNRAQIQAGWTVPRS